MQAESDDRDVDEMDKFVQNTIARYRAEGGSIDLDLPDDVVAQIAQGAVVGDQIVTVDSFARFVAGDESTVSTWFDDHRRQQWICFIAAHAPDEIQARACALKDLNEDLIHWSRDRIRDWNIDMGAVLAAYAMIFRS